MPTIQINGPALPVSRRRSIAVRLTRWFADRGVRPGHVVVRFTEDPPGSVFSGGVPLEALTPKQAEPDGLHHAAVTCCVGPERDEPFREQLAAELANALGMTEQTPYLYIEFRPTSPRQVYLADGGRLRRADHSLLSKENPDDHVRRAGR